MTTAAAEAPREYIVRCPACGQPSPWEPVPVPVAVLVRCVHPKNVTRQMRRQAEREGRNALVDAPICGEIFRVRPIAMH